MGLDSDPLLHIRDDKKKLQITLNVELREEDNHCSHVSNYQPVHPMFNLTGTPTHKKEKTQSTW